MRNKIVLICLTLFAGMLFACGSENPDKKVKATLVGTIQEIIGDNALIHAEQEDGKVLGQIEINLAVNSDENFQVGDQVRVGYDGGIMETAPMKVITISVEKIECSKRSLTEITSV
ncbi:hypothetical protein [Sporosarcina sp.]|uniref:hypothetical protein n=1 Tax=Sporosarcina sp. TaxID=49982 RepID=UPI00262C2F62|nr:hypothetical protein [Sporosarcina sp.]